MHHTVHKLSRSSVKLLEITLGVLIVLMVGLGFALWQMSRQPFDLMFAEDYIERALSTEQYSVNFRDVDLKWPNMKGPLRLDMRGIELKNPDGVTALSADHVDVGISAPFLLIGMIRPVSLYLDNPVLRLVQGEEGNVRLLFQNREVREDNQARPLGEQINSIFYTLADPTEDNFLRRFRYLAIEKAQVILEDSASGEQATIATLNAHFRRTWSAANATADLVLDEGFNNGPGGLVLEMNYDRDGKTLQARADFENLGPAFLTKLFAGNELLQKQAGSLDGQIMVAMDSAEQLTDFSGFVHVKDAEFYWPQQYETPLQIDEFTLKLGFDPSTQVVESEEFTTTLQGTPVRGSLAMQIRDIGYQFLLKLTVPEIKQATLETLFPQSELDGQLAKWLVHKMDGGVFRNVRAALPFGIRKFDREDGGIEHAFMFDERDIHVRFDAEGVDLTYQDTLMPAKDIKGSGTFDGDTLIVKGESGRIGDIDARDVTVTVSDIVVKGGGYADIVVNAKGPLSTYLRYISDDPIGFGDDIPFKPEDVKGTGDLKITVGLPTTEDVLAEEVKVKVTGTLSDLSLPNVVSGMALTGGPLGIETGAGFFTLKGDAALDGKPVTIDMTQYFGGAGPEFLTKVVAKGTSDAAMRDKFGVDLSDFISGDVLLDVTYIDDGQGRESVDVTGDLTPALVHLKPFLYEKAPGAGGSVTLSALLQDNILTKVDRLVIKAPELVVENATLAFRPAQGGGAALAGGSLPSLRIGETQGKATFTVDDNNVLAIEGEASVLDARPFFEGSGRRKQGPRNAAPSQPMTIRVTAQDVIALNDQRLSNLSLYTALDTDADMTRLEISARAGESDVSVQFRPDDQTGARFFRLETLDAGALLAASGLYENIRGGHLYVFGQPRVDDATTGNLIGTAQLENFHVVRAPALAKLFGLMSLGGLNDVLGQQGISFDKLEAGFEWQFRPEGNLLLIDNGRTSGSSVGLTFEGVLDRGADTTDIKGTIIPMTEINNVLKNIPIVGEILTGGTGLIAATYTMKGPSNNPSVMVNPLSVLAPGFLRKLLFEGGFEKPAPQQSRNDAPQNNDVTPPPSPERTVGQ